MEELKKFTGQAMNLDKNDKSLLPTETREVYNSITDRKGVFTRIEGNTLVNFTLPAGDNKVIGWCNDYSRHAIIYFVKNSLGNHCILRVRGRRIDAVLFAQPVLNFKGRITHANTIGDLLYWTDGFFESYSNANPPRKINMVRAIGSLNPYTAQVYQKFDVVNSDGKVYEFIGETPGVFPLTDRDNWAVKGRIYDNLTTDRLYWILDRIKYPRSAEAPVVYYSDNVPAVDPPVIIDPPTLIPYGYLYNWDALFDVVPDPPADALELTFDDIANVPVADAESVSDWNTFFDLPTNGTPFTSVSVDGDKVSLFGGSGITLIDDLFYRIEEDGFDYIYPYDHLLLVEDKCGCIVAAGDNCFNHQTQCTNFDLPELVTAGAFCFSYCNSVTEWSFPKLETVDRNCFYYQMSDASLSSALSFDLPELTQAGEGAFMYNRLVTEFNIPKLTTLTYYSTSYGSFLGCIGVSKFEFPLLTTILNRAFTSCTATEFILPAATTLGVRVFASCTGVTKIYIPSVTDLGGSTGNNEVFLSISGRTIELTVPAALMTCNGGNPDGDIQTLQAANTVTIVTV